MRSVTEGMMSSCAGMYARALDLIEWVLAGFGR